MKAGFQFTLRRVGYFLLFFGVLGTIGTIMVKGGGIGYAIALLAGGVLLIFLGSIQS